MKGIYLTKLGVIMKGSYLAKLGVIMKDIHLAKLGAIMKGIYLAKLGVVIIKGHSPGQVKCDYAGHWQLKGKAFYLPTLWVSMKK